MPRRTTSAEHVAPPGTVAVPGQHRWATPEERHEWALLALQLRRDGVQYRDIARRFGISESTAHALVQWIMRETARPAADELRQQHRERLEAQLALLTPHCTTLLSSGERVPNLRVVEQVRGVLDQLAKLDGLNAPTEVRVSRSDVDAELARLADELSVHDLRPQPVEREPR